MTTSQRPAFDAQATNSDLKSLQQARLGNNILDTYLTTKRLGRYLKRAGETSLVLAKAFTEVTWEPSLGKPYSTMTVEGPDGKPVEKVVYEGDVDVTSLFPDQVYTDPDLDDFSKAEHVTVYKFKNKYNLAARYPQLREKIMKLPTRRELVGNLFVPYPNTEESDSLVCVKSFYHLRTEAVPNGRYMLFGDSDTVMYDGPIQYSRLPVFRTVPGELLGTTDGYTDAYDLLNLQEMMNTLLSTAFSNQNAQGLQKIFLPDGCNISTDLISQGLIVIKGPKGMEPVPLQLTATAPEIFTLLNLAERYSETISGINSVVRGNPEHNLKSGVALNMVQSMAVQYASGFQESWVELLEDVGTFLLVDCLKPFAKTERLISMSGKSNRGAMKSFTGEDLSGVARVAVKMGNPLSRTTAGRVQLAETLLDKGILKTPQEYFQVLETGNLEPVVQGPIAQTDRIRSENEDLLDGKSVRALVSDTHLLDMQEHTTVLNDPEVRRAAATGDPYAKQVVQNTMDHIMEHMKLYKEQEPLWSMINGEPPAPQPPPMPPMGPPPEGGAPMGPPPEQGPPPEAPLNPNMVPPDLQDQPPAQMP